MASSQPIGSDSSAFKAVTNTSQATQKGSLKSRIPTLNTQQIGRDRTISWEGNAPSEEKESPSIYEKVKQMFRSHHPQNDSTKSHGSKSSRNSPTLRNRDKSPSHRSADASPSTPVFGYGIKTPTFTTSPKPRASLSIAQKIPSPADKINFLSAVSSNEQVLVSAYLRQFNYDDEHLQSALNIIPAGLLNSFNAMLSTVKTKITSQMWHSTMVLAWEGLGEPPNPDCEVIFNAAYQALVYKKAERELASLLVMAACRDDGLMVDSLLANIRGISEFSYESTLKLALEETLRQKNSALLELILINYPFKRPTIDPLLRKEKNPKFAGILARFASPAVCEVALAAAEKNQMRALHTAILNVVIERKRIKEETSISNELSTSRKRNEEEEEQF